MAKLTRNRIGLSRVTSKPLAEGYVNVGWERIGKDPATFDVCLTDIMNDHATYFFHLKLSQEEAQELRDSLTEQLAKTKI